MHKGPIKNNRGFTLLLAALIASIVLGIGSSIFSLAQKQITLSSIGRDSQFAFYAADAAAECALYWDVQGSAFGTTSPAVTPTCDTRTLVGYPDGRASAAPYEMSFYLDFFIDADGVSSTPDDNGYCAEVTVSKNTAHPFTVIHADGYSVPCVAKSTSARALQRSVELRY